MTAAAAWGVVCGAGLGTGLWALVSMLPRLSRPRLIHRVAPYLVDVSAGARELLARRPANPLPVLGALFGPAFERLRSVFVRVLGGGEVLRLRLRQSGTAETVETFRSRQLVWGMCGAGSGGLVVFALSRMRETSPLLQLAAVVLCGATAVLLRDRLLQRRTKARLDRMMNELPTVLEFLTLSLSAGEGILDALRRVARIGHGELAGELSGVVTEVNTGLPLAASLTGLADALRLPAFSRCVEQVTGALERGSPLVEVLRAQAQDARDDAKRALLETAGRKEVAMMIPLVFLILPTTIVFAIFPGIFVLQFGF